MRIKKIFIAFICLFLISSITSCMNNKSVGQVSYLDENIYGNKSIRQLLQFTKDQSIEYAGKFTDKNGMFNIRLVFNSAKGIEHKQLLEHIDIINSEGKIKIQDAQFSYDELENAYNILSSRMESLSKNGLVSAGISEDTNRVIVVVERSNVEIKNQISNIVDISLVDIREGNRAVFT